MTATPGLLTTVPFNEPGTNPVDPPAYVSARVLAANTAESITIPAHGNFVRLAGNADFYYSFSGTATVPVDSDDGTACEMIKQQGDAEWRKVPAGATALSVIAAGTAIVTASFYAS
jgi:hypothetical protein